MSFAIVAVRRTHKKDPRFGEESLLQQSRLTDPRFKLVSPSMLKAVARGLDRVQLWDSKASAETALEIVKAAVAKRERLPYEVKVISV